jgi:hypothetical protein
MENPIENSRRDNVILEDISPFAIKLVGSENNRCLFISPADQLEEAICSKLIERQIANLIDDKKLELR